MDLSFLKNISDKQQKEQEIQNQRQEAIYQMQLREQRNIPLDQRIQLQISNKVMEITKAMDDKNTGYLLSYAGYIAGLSWVLEVLKEKKK